jgi:hypothetical protein
VDVLTRQAKREQQSEKSVECGGERHGDAIRSRETVGGNGGSQCAGEKNAGVGEEKKRTPEDGGANGEVVVEMAGGGPKFGLGLAGFIETRAAKALVGMLIIFSEIETVFNQRSTDKSIIANAITAHPGIEKRKREEKEKQEQALGFASARGERGAGGLPIHERGARRNLLLSPAALIAGNIAMWNESPNAEEETW